MSEKISPYEARRALRDIATYYGVEAQLRQLMEESGELIQACNKYLRIEDGGQIVVMPGMDAAECRKHAIDSIIEEIADVDIMIKQAIYLLDISYEDLLKVELAKIKRTHDRMKKQQEMEGERYD